MSPKISLSSCFVTPLVRNKRNIFFFRVLVEDIVNYFMDYYGSRKDQGLVVEKKSSIYCKDGYTEKDVERNSFLNPIKRFEDMRFMSRCRDIECLIGMCGKG